MIEKVDKKEKGLSAFDFDDTLAFTREKVKYTLPNGKKGTLEKCIIFLVGYNFEN